MISTGGVAEVMASDDCGFAKGDLVVGALHWAKYSLLKPGPANPFYKLDTLGFPLTYHLGILGNFFNLFEF